MQIYKYIIPLIWIFTPYQINSQLAPDIELHKKYWYYKSKFNNDFIKIGTGPGESIPFNERGQDGGQTLTSYSESGDRQMHAGDATARLGIYLSVLATEYKLLKNNNQNLTSIKHEIFCALNAINRLDFIAEPIFSNGTVANNLNGFFIRDDIPSNFIANNYSHFNYYNSFDNTFDGNGVPNSRATDHGFSRSALTSSIGGRWRVESTLKSVLNNLVSHAGNLNDYNDKVLHGSETSQDQVYYLLMGLTLTSKLVDPGETDGSNGFCCGANNSDLRQEAINIAERLILHIKNDPGGNWRVRNPAHLFSPGTPVQSGDMAIPYAYALDNLGCFIRNDENLPFCFIPIIGNGLTFPHAPCTNFRNLQSISGAAYQSLGVSGNPGNVDMMGFFHCLAGSGNNLYAPRQLKDLVIQAAINQVLALLADIQNVTNQAVSDFLATNSLNLPQNVIDALTSLNTALNLFTSLLTQYLNQALQALYNIALPTVKLNVTPEALYKNTTSAAIYYFNNCVSLTIPQTHFGSDLYFGLYLRNVLHGFNFNLPPTLQFINNLAASPYTSLTKSDVQNILSDAPCEGNFNFGNGNTPSGAQWGASCFMDRAVPLWNKSNCNNIMGEFSGIDYMLLHNLYYLSEHPTTTDLVDLIDRTVENNFPSGSNFTSLSSAYGAFEHITSFQSIASNGGVTFRAGKEIAFIPDPSNNSAGFSASAGATVAAFIHPYDSCGYTVNNSMRKGRQVVETPKPKTPNFEHKGPPQQKIDEVKNVIEKEREKLLNEIEKQIEVIKENIRVTVFPSPTESYCKVNAYSKIKGDVHIQLTDISGRTLAESQVQGTNVSYEFDLRNYARGTYFITVQLPDGTKHVRKVNRN